MCSIDNVDSLTAQNGGDSVDSIASDNKTAPVNMSLNLSHPVTGVKNQTDHDYEVIKKDDLMRKLNAVDLSPTVSSQHHQQQQQQQQQQITVKHNPVVTNFNDSITYSLLNTKIAEESEDEENENLKVSCIDESNSNKKPPSDLLTNSFAYLKLSDDRSSLELKSVSLRETSTNNDNNIYKRPYRFNK